MASLLTSFNHQQNIWSWLQLKPRTPNPLCQQRQIPSRSCLGNRLVRGGSKAANEPLNSRTHTRARACTDPLIKRPTGTASTDTGPQEVTALSLEMGCVFFRGLALSSWLEAADWAVLSHYTHWKHSRIDAHVHPGSHRIREGDGRWSCDTQRDTQINMLSLMYLGDGNSLLLDCLDQEKEKESEWPFHPVMTATARQQLYSKTHTHAHNRSTTVRLIMAAWLFSSYSTWSGLLKGPILWSNPWKKISF